MSRPIRSLAFVSFALGILWWEHRRFLRPVVDPKWRRDTRNLALAGLAAAATQLIEVPVAVKMATACQRRGWGVLQASRCPDWLKPAAGLVLLDYTLYLWHRATHRVPLLWRFHRVHHIDREMDASTAFRFHFGEITLSVIFRASQIRLIGPTPEIYGLWQMFLITCILFHHSNIRLPIDWERRLAAVLVTPRLHAIHHSQAAEEANSNWSSGLTVWDWLHGTLRTRVPQAQIEIGVKGFQKDSEQRIGTLLVHPFIYAADVPSLPNRTHNDVPAALSD